MSKLSAYYHNALNSVLPLGFLWSIINCCRLKWIDILYPSSRITTAYTYFLLYLLKDTARIRKIWFGLTQNCLFGWFVFFPLQKLKRFCCFAKVWSNLTYPDMKNETVFLSQVDNIFQAYATWCILFLSSGNKSHGNGYINDFLLPISNTVPRFRWGLNPSKFLFS